MKSVFVSGHFDVFAIFLAVKLRILENIGTSGQYLCSRFPENGEFGEFFARSFFNHCPSSLTIISANCP